MKIAIDISPLSSGHKVRGVGFYLKHLQEALLEYFSNNHYIFFKKRSEIPEDVEIVHYPYFDPFFLTLPLGKRKKTIITIHDLTPLVFPNLFPSGIKGRIKWFFQKRALQKIDAIITDSASSKKDITKITSIPKEKIHVAYLAAASEFRVMDHGPWVQEIRAKYQLPEKFALYVGDVTPNKNLPRILKSVLRANVPLIMVGKSLVSTTFDSKNPWNKDLVEVQRLASQNPSIQLLGFIENEDLVKLYNLAHLYVMPSLYEGFGLPVLEAMACGCPVITSKEGSLQEVAGEAAYYVDAYSVDDITHGVQKIIGDPKLSKQFREKGLRQVKKFSWKKTAEETMKVYRSL